MRTSSGLRLRASTAVVAALGAALCLSPPANAAPQSAAAPTCAYNRVCLWSASFFGGLSNSQVPPDPGHCKNLPITVRSVWNNTPLTIRLHVTSACTGGNYIVQPFAQVSDVGAGRRGLGSF